MKTKYLVGYKGERQCVYGKNGLKEVPSFTDPFTDIKKAKKHIKELLSGNCTAIIYKLVPVEEKKVKEYA